MLRTARIAPLLVLLAAGCKKPAPEVPPTVRFMPETAESVVRIDLVKARAWSGYAKAAPVVFKPLAPAIEAVKRSCDLDLVADATSIIVARRGAGATGDMTLVIGGLPAEKLRACPVKVGVTIPKLEIVPDGDRFTVKLQGHGYASGAVLPTGELVVVARGSKNVEPAAWRDEVTAGGAKTPAWWAELDQQQGIAVRMQSSDHTITASAELGDPLVIRGKDEAVSANVAQLDHARLKAIFDFLEKAGAGTGRLEPRELTIHGDLTATGAQIDALVAAGLAAISGEEANAPPEASGEPIACSELGAAVAKYLATSVEAMPADQKIATAPVMEKLVPALQKAYLDSCTIDKWPNEAIHCHVDHAAELPKFEKCRLALSSDQRTHFDVLVNAALNSAR